VLQFLNPIWLLAIGAIIIPLAIHLWNVKKGRTLKIGSIQLLGESSKQNSRSLRFQDLWLLFLRCLLLIILALLLAAPLITRKMPSEKIKGWIMLDRDHLRESYHTFKPTIDSLVKQGFETHYFNPGFEKFNLTDTPEIASNDRLGSGPQLSYWSLVRALDEQLPANASAYLFTNDRMSRFAGNRPVLKSRFIWKTYSSSDSVFNKIAEAYLTQRDSLRIVLEQSRPEGVTYSSENTSTKDLNAAYELSSANGTAIRFNLSRGFEKNLDSSSVAIDTSELRVALYTDKHRADLAYVKAALEAVQTVSQRRMSIKSFSDPDKLPTGLNWIFWLSETPLKEQFGNRAENVFTYQPGKILATNNARIISDNDAFNVVNTRLYKRKSVNDPDEQDLLWEDETGNPILSRTPTDNQAEYKFYSRFDPEWNDLVWEPRFPEALLGLILNRHENTFDQAPNDTRAMSLSQIVPASAMQASLQPEEMRSEETHLDKYLWMLLALLFAIERWFTHKRKSITANG